MASKIEKPIRFKFKSVGKDSSEHLAKQSDIDKQTLPPLSIKTPLELAINENDSLFVAHREIEDTIQDNLRNLLLTNKGERLGRPDLGCSLRNVTFELLNSDDFESIVMNEIQSNVEKYLPFIELKGFNSNNFNYQNDSDTSTAQLQIDIYYDVPTLKIHDKKLSINVLIGG